MSEAVLYELLMIGLIFQGSQVGAITLTQEISLGIALIRDGFRAKQSKGKGLTHSTGI